MLAQLERLENGMRDEDFSHSETDDELEIEAPSDDEETATEAGWTASRLGSTLGSTRHSVAGSASLFGVSTPGGGGSAWGGGGGTPLNIQRKLSMSQVSMT